MTVPKAVWKPLRINPLAQTAAQRGAIYINNLTPECKLALTRDGGATRDVAQYLRGAVVYDWDHATTVLLHQVQDPAQVLLDVIAQGAAFRYGYTGPATAGYLRWFLINVHPYTAQYEAYLESLHPDEVAELRRNGEWPEA